MTPEDNFHETMMRRALDLSLRGWGKTSPNPLVGAVIVRDGEIIAEGWHERCGGPHAEVAALEDARRRGVDVRGATMYVNLEPCSHFGRTPPCSLALIQSGIKKVVTAMVDPNPLVAGRGHGQMAQAGIEVVCGVLETEARSLNDIFIHYITHQRPFVCLKMAASLDGKTATVSGQSRWITGSEARRWVHLQRQRYRAIAVGIGTVLSDDPLLTARDEHDAECDRQPLRVVIDPHLKIPLDSRLVRSASKHPLVVVCDEKADSQKASNLKNLGASIFYSPTNNGILELGGFLEYLYSQDIDSLFLEGGSQTAAHFLEHDAIDKLAVFFSPMIIGGKEAPGLIGGKGIADLTLAKRLSDLRIQHLGQDVLIESYFVR